MACCPYRSTQAAVEGREGLSEAFFGCNLSFSLACYAYSDIVVPHHFRGISSAGRAHDWQS